MSSGRKTRFLILLQQITAVTRKGSAEEPKSQRIFSICCKCNVSLLPVPLSPRNLVFPFSEFFGNRILPFYLYREHQSM